MLRHIYDNLDACYSAGTSYEHYADTLVEIEVTSSLALIEKTIAAGYPVKSLDGGLVPVIARTLFLWLFEAVRRNMPREKAFQYAEKLREFYSAGWFRILRISE